MKESSQEDFKRPNSILKRTADRQTVDPNNLDLFYNQNNFSNGAFSIATFRGNSKFFNALDPQTYGGDLMIHAAFANTEYKLKN
jgi:hypothetical protein